MHRILVALFLTCVASMASAQPFTGVYFFGDSLTDTGNVMEVYADLPVKPPGGPPVVPGPPYDREGRATNDRVVGPGLLYADVLARGLGFDALASERGGNNFAFGGARTRYEFPFGLPFLGIIDQVNAFTARPGPADPDALYVVWAGSNNLQDIFRGLSGPLSPSIAETLNVDIRGIVQSLYDEGARNFLLPNVPNLARAPRVSEFGPGAQALASALVSAYNTQFDLLFNDLEASFPDADLIRFDSFAAFENVVLNGGFTNVTDRCYTGDDRLFTGGGTVCADPSTYVFWDGIHPTSTAHRLLGQQMLAAVIQAVPEPSPFALIAFPLFAGWLATTRRRKVTGIESR